MSLHGEKDEDITIWGPTEGRPEFKALRSQLREEKHLARKPTGTLYHYTDAAGVKGIIESGSLRLTDTGYMNDAGELSYALKLIEGILEERRHSSPSIINLIDKLQKSSNPFRGHFRVYASCFCEEGKLLSQWRSYGLYSIGLRTDHAWRVKGHPSFTLEWEPALMRKVEYDPAKQRHIIRSIVDRVIDLFLQYRHTDSQVETGFSLLDQYGICFSNIVAEYLVAFKDPVFAEEREWRIIHYEFLKDAKPEFRPKGDYLIPYIEMPIRSVNDPAFKDYIKDIEKKEGRGSFEAERSSYVVKNGKFPVGEINIGPSLETEPAKLSIEMLLNRRGHSDVKVSTSTTALRIW